MLSVCAFQLSDCLAPRHTQCGNTHWRDHWMFFTLMKHSPTHKIAGNIEVCVQLFCLATRNASCTYSTSLHLLSWTFFLHKNSLISTPRPESVRPSTSEAFPSRQEPELVSRCRCAVPCSSPHRPTAEGHRMAACRTALSVHPTGLVQTTASRQDSKYDTFPGCPLIINTYQSWLNSWLRKTTLKLEWTSLCFWVLEMTWV